MLSLAATTAAARGAANELLRSAGNQFKVALFRSGVELSGNGYARQTVTALDAATPGTVDSSVDISAPLTFTTLTGSRSFDQYRVYNASGAVLLFVSETIDPVTFGVATPLSLMITFTIPTNPNEIETPLGVPMQGIVDDPDYDNTDDLLDILAQNKAALFGPGRWRFKQSIVRELLADPTVLDMVHLIGAGFENNPQHLEEGLSGLVKNLTIIEYEIDDDEEFWLSSNPEYRIGPWQFENITFERVSGGHGNAIAVGDPDSLLVTPQIRGFFLEHCHFSNPDHQADEFMIDEPAGWVINPTYTHQAVRLARAYNVDIKSTSFFGWADSLHLINCDLPAVDNVRFMVCGRWIDCHSNSISPTAPGRFTRISGEGPYLGALRFDSGLISQVTAEIGEYGQSPTPAARTLPDWISWSIQPGEDFISLEGFDGYATVYGADDYLPPRSTVILTPDQVGEPPIALSIYRVEADKWYFRNADSSSYIARLLNGDGQGILRLHESAIWLEGDVTNLNQWIVGFSGASTPEDVRGLILTPHNKSMSVSGNGSSLPDESNRSLLVMSSGGKQFTMEAGVDWEGRDPPDNPFCNFNGNAPLCTVNYRYPIYYPATDVQIASPARGITYANGSAIKLLVHWVADPLLGGALVPCYRLSDVPGWVIPGLRKPSQALTVKVRVYCAATGTLNCYGGAGSVAQAVISSSGWTTQTFTLAAGSQVSGSFVTLSGQVNPANLYISQVLLDQSAVT